MYRLLAHTVGQPQVQETPPMAAIRTTSLPRVRRLLCAAVLMLTGFGALAATANATPGTLDFATFAAGGFNQDGSPSTQAGAHPYELVSSFAFGTFFDSGLGIDVPDAAVKDTVFDLPAGVIGDPNAVPRCHESEIDPTTTVGNCAPDTQVGYADVDRRFIFRGVQRSPVYNIVPAADEAAAFRFTITGSIVHIGLKVRSDGDYGVVATVHNINAGAPVFGVTLHLWGIPSDPSHTPQRYYTDLNQGVGAPSGTERLPFLRNPTSCSGPVTTTVRATSWEEPDQIVTDTAQAPAVTGCDRVPFAPTLSVRPDTSRAGSAAGFGIDLDVPQNTNPDGLATADLKTAVVTLPEGVVVNPSAADGLQGCTDAEFGLHAASLDACPDGSVIGSTEITTPLLSKPLEGRVYLGIPLDQSPAGAAAGDMIRVFLEAHGVGGVQVKLVGTAVPDPVTGQLRATFDNNPQLPFTNLHLSFNGGARAPLALPKACGTYTTHSQFTSWATSTPVQDDGSFTIDQNCDQAGRFEPTLAAGLSNPVAGASSSFTMTLARPDGQQDISGLDLALPPGLLGDVGSVPLCPEELAVAGTCSSASQIGKTTVASGAGSTPVYLPQTGKTPTAVYLAGPYKGAPFSLSIVVPAQAGPFDLGTVVVRAALFIDNRDAHVTVKADPVPTILNGVPLNIQKINVTLDRPGFMISPTNCSPMAITGQATSSQGATASLSSRFQAANCAALPFNPKFSASTDGTLKFKKGAEFKVHIAMPDGDANIKSLALRLPKELPSRLIPTINNACLETQFAADYAKCPEDSYVGTVQAVTPILPDPLTGPVYIVAHPGDVPTLEFKLMGHGIGTGVNVDLGGSIIIDSGGGRSKATFSTVPDVPISSFDVDLPTGPHSILDAPSGDLCKGPITADLVIVGQNGKTQMTSPVIGVSHCPKIPAAKLISARATAAGVTIKVKPAAVGKVTVSGAGLKSVTKTIVRLRTTYTFAAHLTARGKAASANKGGFKVTPKVSFKPTNGPKTLTTMVKALTVTRS